EAFASEGLRADDRYDLVAVDVNVAGVNPVHEMLHAPLYPRVQTEGQAVALAVDRGDDLIDLVCIEGSHMQDGTEYLPIHLLDALDLQHTWRDEAPLLGRLQRRNGAALLAHHPHIIVDRFASFLVDHRTHIGRRIPRIADLQSFHCPLEHFQDLLLHILLDIEDAQGRAALASALE